MPEMPENSPLVSIVTVVFNGESYLEETILSVSNQRNSQMEHIIVDGGSTDGTVDILKKYNHKIDCWISEPDQGIYHAMNKGVTLANGKFIGFLNASDIFYKNTLNMIISAIQERDFDYSMGPVDIVNFQGIKLHTALPLKNFIYKQGSYMQMSAPHMSVFIKRQLFEMLGGYDVSFRLSADYDLLLRLAQRTNNVFYLDNIVGAFKLGGKSGSIGTYIDNFRVLKKHKLHWFINVSITTCYLLRWGIALVLPEKLINFFRHNK